MPTTEVLFKIFLTLKQIFEKNFIQILPEILTRNSETVSGLLFNYDYFKYDNNVKVSSNDSGEKSGTLMSALFLVLTFMSAISVPKRGTPKWLTHTTGKSCNFEKLFSRQLFPADENYKARSSSKWSSFPKGFLFLSGFLFQLLCF